MRTRLAIVAAVGAAALTLSACSTGSDSSIADEPNTATNIATLEDVDEAPLGPDGYFDYITPDEEGASDSWNPPVVPFDSKVKVVRGQYFFLQDFDSLVDDEIFSLVKVMDKSVLTLVQQGPGSLVMFQANQPGKTRVNITYFDMEVNPETGAVKSTEMRKNFLDVMVEPAPEGKEPWMRSFIGDDPAEAQPTDITSPW
jgi:hypothetical protein